MSKYEPLWKHLQERGESEFKLTSAEIAAVLGFEIDHAFLTYKKEAAAFGYVVGKISMKEKQVTFKKIELTDKPRIFKTAFSDVYPMYVQKVERKGRTAEEVETVTCWLTGYDKSGLHERIDNGTNVETFFAEAPQINSNAHKITGKVCGVQVETIADPIMQNIRRLDKLVDELARGKSLYKVLRV